MKKVLDFFEKKGITELRPPQQKAVDKGLFEEKNLVVASPTASGKTLVAEMAFLNNIMNGKGKALYLVPLRALGFEKHAEFKEKYDDYKIGLSVGDYDSKDEWLSSKDVIISSFEKMDSLMRHGAPWVFNVGTVVIDECHLITSQHRGPTLEVLVTKLKKLIPEAQFVALSATISNSEELAEWLDAQVVKSDYRPVKLHKGIYLNGKIHFGNEKRDVSFNEPKPSYSIAKDTLSKNKQALFFLSSRRNAQSLARRLREHVKPSLKRKEREELKKISDEVRNTLESPTPQCKELARCVKDGVCFHHAGLLNSQRKALEDAFKKGMVKIICATPTLAMGVNLPAWRVVIRDLKRYSKHHGMAWIPVLEYHQFAGRAGRPGYDDEGQALCVAKTEAEKEEILERYVLGESEEILSKLGVEPVLRMHSLALIASLFARSRQDLENFFEQTFYAKQYGSISEIETKLEGIVNNLIDWGFVTEDDDKLRATKLGRRVSELYLDPLTGKKMIDGLREAKETMFEDLSFVHLACNTLEMKPLLRVKNKEFMELQSQLVDVSNVLLHEEPSPWDYDYMDYVKAFKTSLMFMDWLNELPDDKLMKKWNMPPGKMRVKLYNIDWLLYSAQELATLLKVRNVPKTIRDLRLRLKHGIKKELLSLVKFKGVGRVRSRKLYENGIKTVGDVKKTPLPKLEGILGKKTARKIKEQAGGKIVKQSLKEWSKK